MLTLAAIFFGAAFTLLTAYALGMILLRKTPAPPEIALALGAVAESFLVFLALLANAAHWVVFLAAGGAAVAALKWVRRVPLSEPAKAPLGRAHIAACLILGLYAAWYFVNALAPEILADGITYHLGLPYEYVRLGGFPDRIAFFDMAPQGMEMLYAVAFAFGRHSAAKLVEFGFFLASLPLIFRVGRRLGIGDLASLTAAAFYFCAPVAGITGSSSYNDAAAVFFTLAAFYLLLVWRDTSDGRYLLPAGALAGFCYAIKFPGVFAAAGAVLFILAHRRVRAAALVALGAALVMVPWLARDFALTGNPVAPLMNGLFPNPWFHVARERELAASLRSFGPIGPANVPWQLAFGDRLTGTFGPLFLALPLALLALRRSAGRLLLAAAVLLAVPWFFNTGARFLMPSVVFAALALGMALPRRVAWAAIALQAALCWPQAIDLWETRPAFRLHEFPLRAALRLTPEAQYIRKRAPEYDVARMVERSTPPDARVLSLIAVAGAYLDRDAAVTWQSAEGDRMLDVLNVGAPDARLYEWKAEFPLETVAALRFRIPETWKDEWMIHDVQVYSGEDQVFNSPQWTLRAWPNPWEAPLAFDPNPATRWRTWEPAPRGAYLEIDFDHPHRLSSAVLVLPALPDAGGLEVYGRTAGGKWRALSHEAASTARPAQDLRLEATRALRRAGFRYVLAATGSGGTASIGNKLAAQAPEWGMEIAGDAGSFLLFHIK